MCSYLKYGGSWKDSPQDPQEGHVTECYNSLVSSFLIISERVEPTKETLEHMREGDEPLSDWALEREGPAWISSVAIGELVHLEFSFSCAFMLTWK